MVGTPPPEYEYARGLQSMVRDREREIMAIFNTRIIINTNCFHKYYFFISNFGFLYPLESSKMGYLLEYSNSVKIEDYNNPVQIIVLF